MDAIKPITPPTKSNTNFSISIYATLNNFNHYNKIQTTRLEM